MRKQGKLTDLMSHVPNWVWLLISLVMGFMVWQLLADTPKTSIVFASPKEIVLAFIKEEKLHTIWTNIGISLFRVLAGFAIGFVVAIPIAFLMGWYKIFRNLVEPWIQFIRNIPPIAYIPLIIAGVGVGERAKVTVIFIATFLVMVVSIYQGVRNVDETLIKAAKILGANNRVIFLKVVVPASIPFILVGVRLGLAAALTTLVAAEMTGASSGLGMMVWSAGQYFDMPVVLLGIIIIGIIGLIFEEIVKFLERRLTGWQETHVA
ncbi:Binding-protein-dependent transport system inner membrane component [Acididesulfobacillus acetoxydans]|uniref:Binding-protein-dependent transport system inner membrane component n=1 Tax=Acididesulfobacillus acetoxydans TaxID=1561005 RepID=A0A8S0Y2F5_9FIRM|nr:ABC transporter permease [Acididesulfobacillus acetoxydans]CAA7600745.1 Binding-protein-dependent transport system inner membrane component [Acididesulfobacillus acetoxydans]CEJ07985.1 Taurine ABC transporter, permease protein [Acididesulfobacillus acetoxydans]